MLSFFMMICCLSLPVLQPSRGRGSQLTASQPPVPAGSPSPCCPCPFKCPQEILREPGSQPHFFAISFMSLLLWAF